MKEKDSLKGDILITTEKDWTRIRDIAVDNDSLAFLTINFIILSGKDALFKMIKEKTDSVFN